MQVPKTYPKAPDPNEGIWRDLVQGGLPGDGSAAEESLAAGFPIYYTEDDTPEGLLIKEHPSGRRELVRLDVTGGKPDEVIRVL